MLQAMFPMVWQRRVAKVGTQQGTSKACVGISVPTTHDEIRDELLKQECPVQQPVLTCHQPSNRHAEEDHPRSERLVHIPDRCLLVQFQVVQPNTRADMPPQLLTLYLVRFLLRN